MLFGDIEKSKRLALNIERIFPVNRVRWVVAKGEDQEPEEGGRRRTGRKASTRRRDLHAVSAEDVVTLSRKRRPQGQAGMEDYSSLKPPGGTPSPATAPKSSGNNQTAGDRAVQPDPAGRN